MSELKGQGAEFSISKSYTFFNLTDREYQGRWASRVRNAGAFKYEFPRGAWELDIFHNLTKLDDEL